MSDMNTETTNPVNATVTKRSKRSIKEQMEAIEQAKQEGKFEQLPAGTEADAERATSPFNGKHVEEREVPDKVFENMIRTVQSGIVCYTVNMTFQDIVDYGTMAEDLEYEAEPSVSSEGNGIEPVSFEDASITRKWQRYYEVDRGKKAANYLVDNPVHFFPPLICVPVNGTYESLKALDGTDTRKITLSKDSIAFLDGQHRAGGIEFALEEKGSLASETMPVCILVIDPKDVTAKQQLFADVNKSPKKVSKALQVAYDNHDPTILAAKEISEHLSGNLVAGHQSLVDWDRTSALKGGGKKSKAKGVGAAMTLVNLVQLIQGSTYKDQRSRLLDSLSPQQLTSTVKAVVDNLPDLDKIRTGVMTLGEVQKVNIWAYSAIYQAIGNCLNQMVGRKKPLTAESTDVHEFEYPREHFAEVVADKMVALRNANVWNPQNEVWKGVVESTKTGFRVGSRADHIRAATEILADAGLR